MNFLPIWTTCFVVANLNVRYSIAFNETDTKWESVGSETRYNTTTQVLPTKILKINHELFIGGFFDLNTPHGAGELYATMMAVKEINHDPTFLADYKIALFHKRSTEGELSVGTSVLYDYLHTEPTKLMLLGPFDDDLAKTVAAYAGLPEFGVLQFSYGATDLELTKDRKRFPLFFRTVPTERVFNEPRLRFIHHFGWKDEIGLIYDTSPYYSQINEEFAESLERNGTTIVANEGFTQDPGVAVKTLKEKGAHVIVGTFPHSRAREVFCQAYLNDMKGENYVWIITSIPDVNSTSDWWIPEPSSKLGCTRSQMEEVLDHHFTFYFKNQIRGTLVSGKTTDQFFTEYNQDVPAVFRSTRAPFAYEAMWAIAVTLERARPILSGWNLKLHELAYGRQMVSQLLKEEAFEAEFTGPSGEVSFDENGDRRCKVFIQQFRKSIGVQEVGIYDYNPPTLTLKGKSEGNGTPVALERVQWPAGRPYQRKASSDSWLYIRFPLFISCSLLSGILLLCCVLCYASLLVFRRHRVIQHSGFYLTQLLILGCMFSLFSVVLFGIDGSLVSFEAMQWLCKARSWCLSLGYTICLASLLPRVLFAYRVVSWRPVSIKKVPWKWMHWLALCIFLTDVIILVIWQLLFDPRAVKVLREVARPRPYEEQTLLIEKCVSNYEEAALALLLVPKGILLLIGALAAWPARRLYFPLCNNTRDCCLCVLISAVMCIIETPIIMRVRNYPNSFYCVTGFLIMALTAALLIIGVFPQLKRAQKCKRKALISSQECNGLELVHENSCSQCECNVCADPKTFRPQLASCSSPDSCARVYQDCDYMVNKVPNRTTENEPRIVTERVYVDQPVIPTAESHTQTLKVTFETAEIQTTIVRTKSASMLTEPETVVEQAEVMLQTEEEEPKLVVNAETQTINAKLRDKNIQTTRKTLLDIHVQTVQREMSHAEIQTDDPPPPPDILSEESDTASVTSSISASPTPERRARKKKLYDIKPKIDTNLSAKRKEMVIKSSNVSTPRLRVTTPVPYNSRAEDYSPLSPRSRDPSPAPMSRRGSNR